MGIFFTKIGWLFGIISIFLIIISAFHIANYEGGWAIDLRYLPLYLLSQPLLYLTGLKLDDSYSWAIAYLWILTILNLAVITYSIDLMCYGLANFYKFIKKRG